MTVWLASHFQGLDCSYPLLLTVGLDFNFPYQNDSMIRSNKVANDQDNYIYKILQACSYSFRVSTWLFSYFLIRGSKKQNATILLISWVEEKWSCSGLSLYRFQLSTAESIRISIQNTSNSIYMEKIILSEFYLCEDCYIFKHWKISVFNSIQSRAIKKKKQT